MKKMLKTKKIKKIGNKVGKSNETLQHEFMEVRSIFEIEKHLLNKLLNDINQHFMKINF